jgi:uncharacterized protein
MKELAVYLLRSLVDNPDDVNIDTSEENNVVRFKVKVAGEDKGKVIGKDGKVIKSIRTVLSASAMKENKKVFLDLE